ASGGVGSAAVQLARRRGARVIAIAGTGKGDVVASLGASAVLPRDSDWLAQLGHNSVDVAIDVVGGPRFGELLHALRAGGRCAIAGAIAGPAVQLDLRSLYLKDLRILGCTIPEPGVFGRLIDYIEHGEIRPLVSRTYPLQAIVAAQQDFLSKRYPGKLVLIPASI
ncbi:MAG: zinc-binding dehydrogenase, partial [Sinobacteraceae bacterium]|nr:zinc-binding dehydrogenase [Nevskiaceae bacterium]